MKETAVIDVVAVPVPLEPTTPIKPSEAIRLGCLLAPVQGHGQYFPDEHSACAIGALILGYGGPREQKAGGGFLYAHGLFGLENGAAVDCPAPEHCRGRIVWGRQFSPRFIVEHLNDNHHWPRERIADWLEGLGL